VRHDAHDGDLEAELEDIEGGRILMAELDSHLLIAPFADEHLTDGAACNLSLGQHDLGGHAAM